MTNELKSKEFDIKMPDGCSMTFVECEDEDIPKDFDGDNEDIDFSKLYPENVEFPDGIEADDIYYEEEEDPIYEVPLATGEPFRVGDILYRIVPGYGIYKKVGKHKYYVSLLGNLDESTFYDLIPNIIRFLRAKSCNITPDVVYIDMGTPCSLSDILKIYNIGYMSYDSDLIEPDLRDELDFMNDEFVMDEFESIVYPCIQRVRY